MAKGLQDELIRLAWQVAGMEEERDRMQAHLKYADQVLMLRDNEIKDLKAKSALLTATIEWMTQLVEESSDEALVERFNRALNGEELMHHPV